MSANKINKSDFIRSISFDTAASDVVEAGKKKGLNLSVEYVHTIRSNARAAKKKEARALSRKTKPEGNVAPSRSAEKLLAYAAEVGYAEAIRLIQEARPKVS